MTSHCVLLFNSFAANFTVTLTIILYTALISLSPCESPHSTIIHMSDSYCQIALQSLNLLDLCYSNTTGTHGVKFPILVVFYILAAVALHERKPHYHYVMVRVHSVIN